MTPDENPSPAARRGLSIAYKLPILITGLLVLVVGAALVVTYREVTRSSRTAAVDRIRRLTRQLAASVEVSTQQLALRTRTLGADSTVRRALAGERVDAAAFRRALGMLQTPTDSGLRLELWSADRHPVNARGGMLLPAAEAGPADVIPPRDDSTRFGPFYPADGHIAYWMVFPVRHDGRLVGWLAQQRRLGTSLQARRQLDGLLGPGMSLYFRNDSGSLWTTIDGHVVEPPSATRREDGVIVRERRAAARGPLLADEAVIGGTPWSLTLELPDRTATADSRGALARLALLSVALLVGGVVVAYLISLRLTRPLVELTAAAESIARGDYSHRIDESRIATGDETGRLAASFNRMVSEVAAARAELQRQVEASERARQDADAANRAKSAFLATMSHELRTPLNAIAGYAQLLELGIHGPLSDEQRDVLGRVQRSQRTLLSLIDDVLSFARIEAGRVEYRLADVVLDDVLSDAQPMIEPQANAKRITYEYRPAGEHVHVWTDPDKLAQIVLNLLANAVKFTPEHGRIIVTTEDRGAEMLVRVTDTGRGISPDKLDMIFEPFTQGESGLTRTAEGTGLGLAISREFARTMGGDLTVESAPGAGSTFILRLPSRAPPAFAGQRDGSSQSAKASAV